MGRGCCALLKKCFTGIRGWRQAGITAADWLFINLLYWIIMSDVDKFFPPRGGRDSRAPRDEQRFIRATDRKSGQSRSIEVVQLSRHGIGPADDQVRTGSRGVRGEAWPVEFEAKPKPPLTPFDTQPSPTPSPAPQVGHVVERTPRLLAALPVQPELTAPRQARGRPRQERIFADPFAADDSGANCFRCGYLVEAAREKRGKLTCAACD